MTVKPISPDEVIEKKKEEIPDFVIEEFNKVIAEKWDGKRSTVFQDDIVNRIVNRSPLLINRRHVYDHHWLDVEDIYRAQGWVVKYDKPHYTENYEAHFIFTKP